MTVQPPDLHGLLNSSADAPGVALLQHTRDIDALGCAVDRKRLTWLIVNCFRDGKCFTCQFRSQYRRTRREMFSALSRVQNIGYEIGENGWTPEWYRANHRTPWITDYIEAKAFFSRNGCRKHTGSNHANSERLSGSNPR